MPASFQGSSFLLTYPQSSFGKESLFNFLQSLPDISYVKVAQELHEDGSTHYHAITHFNRKQRCSATYFDHAERHPNVKTVGRKKSDWDNVVTYLDKEDQSPTVWGTPRHTTSVWSDVATATSRTEALEIIKKERPRDFVLNARNLDYFLDKVCIYISDSKSTLSSTNNYKYYRCSQCNRLHKQSQGPLINLYCPHH